MDSEESRLIEILRVYCITAMMWVHVNPGMSAPSIVSTGDYALVGTILGNTLGRISVSLLSFVSGYLFWKTARHSPIGTVAMRRFRTVLIPMLVWSAIYLVLAAAKEPLTGVTAHKIEGIDIAPGSLANAWAGITGPTANLSLFFLRDLFVATLILRAAVPLIERVPVLVTLAVLTAASTDVLAPVIFRSSILQFMFFGALTARLGYTIHAISRPLVTLPIGYLMTVAGLAAVEGQGNSILQMLHIPLLLRRVGVCFLSVALLTTYLSLFPRTAIDRIGRHAYLAYLMHVPLLGILWVVWLRFVGGANATSYLGFYLTAPFLVLAAAVLAGRTLDRAPPVLQVALRGRVARPKGVPGSD